MSVASAFAGSRPHSLSRPLASPAPDRPLLSLARRLRVAPHLRLSPSTSPPPRLPSSSTSRPAALPASYNTR